ncbi:hypothetical protein DEU42_108147 [Flavobacterium sp. AG291]|nr:hypothetical protein DEU42_108147 [Flavobacterium sp. AG291]
MHKITILFFLFTSYSFYSQSISSYMNFINKREFYSNKSVAEATIDYTQFNNSGKKEKEINVYNIYNKIQNQVRYDEKGKLIGRSYRQYDEKGNNIITRFTFWHPAIGYTSQSTEYKYDGNNFLTGIISRDSVNNIIRESLFVNDEQGKPIELIVSVKEKLEGRETAIYNYETNEVEISYFNSLNQFISKSNGKINHMIKEPGDIVSEYGDIIKSKSFEQDITYDKYGNWIKKIHYKIVGGKKIKQSDLRRHIKYKKED